MNCYFCQRNVQDIDFRNTMVLRRFISSLGKIKGRKKTNLCATHQRKVSTAIKRARHIGILSHSSK